MNKKNVLASLGNIANEFDNIGQFDYANIITNVMTKLALNEETFEGLFCPECGNEADKCDCGYIEERKKFNTEKNKVELDLID